jgi:predicted transcriptional regulator
MAVQTLTLGDIATKLGVCKQTVRRWIKSETALCEKLTALGHKPGQWYYKPKEAAIILEHFEIQ